MFQQPEKSEIKKIDKEHRKSRRHKRRKEKREKYKNLHKPRPAATHKGEEQKLQKLTQQTQNDLQDVLVSSPGENESYSNNNTNARKPVGMRPSKHNVAKSILPTQDQITLAYEAGARKARPGLAPSVNSFNKPPPSSFINSNNNIIATITQIICLNK